MYYITINYLYLTIPKAFLSKGFHKVADNRNSSQTEPNNEKVCWLVDDTFAGGRGGAGHRDSNTLRALTLSPVSFSAFLSTLGSSAWTEMWSQSVL